MSTQPDLNTSLLVSDLVDELLKELNLLGVNAVLDLTVSPVTYNSMLGPAIASTSIAASLSLEHSYTLVAPDTFRKLSECPMSLRFIGRINHLQSSKNGV
jgi:hypothetical protein